MGILLDIRLAPSSWVVWVWEWGGVSFGGGLGGGGGETQEDGFIVCGVG